MTEGFKIPMEEVLTDFMEIVRELGLQIEPGNVMGEELLLTKKQRKSLLEIESILAIVNTAEIKTKDLKHCTSCTGNAETGVERIVEEVLLPVKCFQTEFMLLRTLGCLIFTDGTTAPNFKSQCPATLKQDTAIMTC